MKRTSQHAFEPEEIMAYLDGELPTREAAELASHLELCGECQAVGAQMRQVSERMLDFQIEPCPARVDEAVLKAADEKASEPAASAVSQSKPRRRRALRILAWAGGFAAVLLVAALFWIPNLREYKRAEVSPAPRATDSALADKSSRLEVYSKIQALPSNGPAALAPGPPPVAPAQALGRSVVEGLDAVQPENQSQTTIVQGPIIVQTASVTILASNYDQASGAIQRITAQHGGYVQELNADTPTGAARSMSATLRVPEKQLEPCLTDLRKLGHVEQEWRNNQEITDQYIDLTARLKNARAEEQRIIQLLTTKTGKLSDVLAAERELARVRGEIESMDGQRAYMEHEVSYATVQVQVDEEYRAELNPGAVSTGTRIRNSLVEGFRNLGEGAVALLIFTFAYGPSILFWLALIGVIAWFAWRCFRRARTSAS
jgi:hypothetical protein